MFEMDYRLENDCVFIGTLSLCRIMLMKDANYPWVILVPQRADISEVFQLDPDDQEQLIWESSFVAERLLKTFDGDKMNIAALGNVVPQLHIHHVVRSRNDAAWPSPVWGAVPAKAYIVSELDRRVELLKNTFETSTFKPAGE